MLNSICTRTGYFEKLPQRVDSIHLYASKALNEATKMRYKAGIAMALLNLSGLEAVGYMPVTDEVALEKNIRRAIQLGEEIKDNDVLGLGYYCLSGAPSVKNDFEKVVNCFKKSIPYFQKSRNVLLEAEVTNWLCGAYLNIGEYEKAFDYGKKVLNFQKKVERTFPMYGMSSSFNFH
jgi:tetratricopeptide (TPR) repeat protein